VYLRRVLQLLGEYLVWTTGFLVISLVLLLDVSVESFRYAGF
jgi:hypothetical protein